MDEAIVQFSMTFDGHTWTGDYPMQYGTVGQFDKRFIALRIGYVNNYTAFRFRWSSKYRMAFSAGVIDVN